MIDGLTLPLVIGAALADSINPCIFGVLIFLVAFMTKIFKKPKQMLIGGMVYTTIVYLSYLFIGLGILAFTASFGLSSIVYWIAAIIAILAGLLEIKDYFWYGKGFTLQLIPGSSERIKYYTKKIGQAQKKSPLLSYLLAAGLGFFVVLVELPCTGAPYLAILGLLSQGDYVSGIPFLLLYNFIFILPLFIIIGLAYFGTSSKSLKKWKEKNKGLMRLAIGLFLVLLGAYMIYSISYL